MTDKKSWWQQILEMRSDEWRTTFGIALAVVIVGGSAMLMLVSPVVLQLIAMMFSVLATFGIIAGTVVAFIRGTTRDGLIVAGAAVSAVLGLIAYGNSTPAWYPLAIGAAGLATWRVARWQGWAAAAVALLAIIAIAPLGYLDTYESRWRKNETKTDYVDTYGRWSGRLIYREVWGADFEYAKGPMSPGRQPHGHWEQGKLFRSHENVFYWYGEEVTEAQWHLLNKD